MLYPQQQQLQIIPWNGTLARNLRTTSHGIQHAIAARMLVRDEFGCSSSLIEH